MKILLCGRGKCCPSVEKIDGAVVIEDDDQRIEITDEQWANLIIKILEGGI